MIFLVAGLGFGDEGKGTLTDYLVRSEGVTLVVRYNGGPQAAHHVVSPAGRRHTFAQFGAGTLVPGTCTLLSREMLVEPLALLREAQALQRLGVLDALDRLTIDRRSVVVTPFHRALNRLRESCRGRLRHGTCGLGVGEARLDAESGGLPCLRMADLEEPRRARRILRQIQMVKLDQGEQLADEHPEADLAPYFEDLRGPHLVEDLIPAYGDFLQSGVALAGPQEVGQRLRAEDHIVFEGAQGALLHRDWGFWPHVTPSRTDFEDAFSVLDEAAVDRPRLRIGVLRTYASRHGEGPLVTEDPEWSPRLPETDNHGEGWQGAFRVGPFDAVLARYALKVVGGVDRLALTHLDRLPEIADQGFCSSYQWTQSTNEFPKEHFEGTEDQIRNLRMSPHVDLEFQGRLGQALNQCRPHFEKLPNQGLQHPETSPDLAKRFIEWLESNLGAKVGWESWGPSADQKVRR